MRGLLVVVQFTISVILITGTIAIINQMDYIRNRNLGYTKEQILILHDTNLLGSNLNSFKNEIVKHPDVVNETVSGFLPVTSNRLVDIVRPEGNYREKGAPLQIWDVDHDYIQTLGMKMTKLKPVHGFCAETAAASSILLSTVGGIPVSTTHTITGAIIGVGATTKLSAVRWGVAANIVFAWLLTIPTTAVISGVLYSIFNIVRGT